MKPHERRQRGLYPYYKLAVWDPVSQTWRDGKTTYQSADAATQAAWRPGRYRVSAVLEDGGRDDLAPFTISG